MYKKIVLKYTTLWNHKWHWFCNSIRPSMTVMYSVYINGFTLLWFLSNPEMIKPCSTIYISFLSSIIQIVFTIGITIRKKEITTLRINLYWIFHHTVIETCFEIIKYSEHEKLWRYSTYKSPNSLDFLILLSWSPNLNLLFIPYIIRTLDAGLLWHWIVNFVCFKTLK